VAPWLVSPARFGQWHKQARQSFHPFGRSFTSRAVISDGSETARSSITAELLGVCASRLTEGSNHGSPRYVAEPPQRLELCRDPSGSETSSGPRSCRIFATRTNVRISRQFFGVQALGTARSALADMPPRGELPALGPARKAPGAPAARHRVPRQVKFRQVMGRQVMGR